jgi:hypothetical protein
MYSPSVIFFFFFLLLWWVWVHCGIYKSSHSISNIKSFIHSLHHSPLSLLHSCSSFNRYIFHLYTCIHSIYTIFTLLHPLSLPSSFPVEPNPVTKRDLFGLPVLQFCKRKTYNIFVCLR